jgi:hypothetical protein
LAQHVTITIAKDPPTPLAADVTVTLRDGRVLKRSIADFKGTPEQPLDGTELREKFLLLTRHCDAGRFTLRRRTWRAATRRPGTHRHTTRRHPPRRRLIGERAAGQIALGYLRG